MNLNWNVIFIVLIYMTSQTRCIPLPQDDHLVAEARFHKKKNNRNGPCGGGGGIFGKNAPEPRTFVDWNINFVNYNYNTLCGGGGGVGGNQGGGHLQPIRDHFASHLQGVGGTGIFGLGFWNLLFGMNGNLQSSRPNPDLGNQFDDVKPDANVASTGYNNNNYNSRPRPRPLANAYQNPNNNINPLLGNYYGQQDIVNFNPNKIIKQANRQFNKLIRPLYDLFRK